MTHLQVKKSDKPRATGGMGVENEEELPNISLLRESQYKEENLNSDCGFSKAFYLFLLFSFKFKSTQSA